MNKITELKNLSAEINAEHEIIINACKSAVIHAMKAGELLNLAKSMVKHGGWLTWLECNFLFSERTAQAYMKIFREYPKLENSKAQRVADLSLSGALQLLASPKKPETELERAEKFCKESDKLHGELSILAMALQQAEVIDEPAEQIRAFKTIAETARDLHANAVENQLRAEREVGRLIIEWGKPTEQATNCLVSP